MKKPTKTIKKVLGGYGIILDGNPAHYLDGQNICIFLKKAVAQAYYPEKDGYKVVKVVITYSLDK